MGVLRHVAAIGEFQLIGVRQRAGEFFRSGVGDVRIAVAGNEHDGMMNRRQQWPQVERCEQRGPAGEGENPRRAGVRLQEIPKRRFA